MNQKTENVQKRLKNVIIQNTDLKYVSDNTIVKGVFFPWSLLNYSMEEFKNEIALGSLEFIALVAEVESEFDIDITDQQLIDVVTVGDFLSLVEKLTPTAN